MTQVTISNAGGTLNCDATKQRERQVCKVPIRDVPTRTTGSFVDVGTYTLKNRRLYMTIRLTDAEKTTLQAIFDQNVVVTIDMKITDAAFPKWTYTAWFEQKPIIYEYSVDGSGNTREWLAELVFICGGAVISHEYILACPCDRADGFETGAEDAMWTTVVVDPYDIVTTVACVHCGTYGAISDNTNGVWIHNLSGTNVVKWFKWHYKIIPNPDSPPAGVGAGRLLIIEVKSGATPWWMSIYVVTGGPTSPRFRLQDDDSNTDDGTHALANNTWYCVRLRIELNGSTVKADLYVNGSLDCNLNTAKAGFDTFSQVMLECIQWTFLMDCRTALDCWCEVDGDDSDLCTLPSSCW